MVLAKVFIISEDAVIMHVILHSKLWLVSCNARRKYIIEDYEVDLDYFLCSMNMLCL